MRSIKLIKLTALDGKIIRVNPEFIGTYQSWENSYRINGGTVNSNGTNIIPIHGPGVICVRETPEELDKLINSCYLEVYEPEDSNYGIYLHEGPDYV